ncbi:Chorismate mutase [Rhizobiales bacterium GAS113]|jgi:chorismate mutase|nr:Chorismate mutase [Rhizobiales bacterium GAS113]SEC26120.1 Chorismate mutase [Rhizobiales bacterium GAS188]
MAMPPVRDEPGPPPQPPLALADLRREIDRIDETMHRLLMERGAIIATLIQVKKSDETGSAFRPGREADMMRRLAARHGGLLPLDTAEGIWRVIIGTFTYVQKAYSVHADISGGDAPMRDSARFHFGFTVPYLTHDSAAEVIAAVAASAGDLGMFRADQGAQAGAWWTALVEPAAPKIIARLPFIERPGHPAGTPVYVVAKPLAEAAARERVLISVALERWHAGVPASLAGLGAAIISSAAAENGLSLLVEGPGDLAAARLLSALSAVGTSVVGASEVGSHAERFTFAV